MPLRIYLPYHLHRAKTFGIISPALEDEPREVVIATYLDNKHHVLSIEEVSRGTLTASLFEPRAILQGALLTNAAALIVLA